MSKKRVVSALMSKRPKPVENEEPEIVRLNVVVSKDEYDRLQAKLKTQLKTVSSFIRECISGYLSDN